MKKKYFLLSLSLLANSICTFAQSSQLTVFNKIVFYDGYAAVSTAATPAGVVRLENSRYAKKLDTSEIANMQNTLSLDVKINALCDNYDRQGGVFFALVPVGEGITSPNKKTIEIGRFITPFMNKNVTPNEVSYNYNLNHLMGMFKNQTFLQKYDIWVEFFLFGVPYAAQKQISGCSGRTDVFEGTVTFSSDNNVNPVSDYIPKPLWSRLRMNKTNDSDFPGTAGRVFYFSNDTQLVDAGVHLVTSAHGAGQNGEEYVRRKHFVYLDDVEILNYTPGGLSCEPFRKYNTQANGIYGSSAQSASWWASWNNWCPGDKIPNRLIALGDIDPGSHSFKVSVPTGQFPSTNDEIFLSAFIYSKDNVVLDNAKFETVDYRIYPNPATDKVTISTSDDIQMVTVTDLNGRQLIRATSSVLNVQTLPAGIYLLQMEFKNGIKTTEKLVKN